MKRGWEEPFLFLLSVSLCSLGRCGFVRVCAWLREEEGNFFLVISFFEEHSHSFVCSFFSFFPLFPRERCLLLKESDYSLCSSSERTRGVQRRHHVCRSGSSSSSTELTSHFACSEFGVGICCCLWLCFCLSFDTVSQKTVRTCNNLSVTSTETILVRAAAALAAAAIARRKF